MSKTKRITFIALTSLVVLMMSASAAAKISGAEKVVTGLTMVGFGPGILALAFTELLAAVLFIFTKTYRIGFYLLLSYLGGAMAIEIATQQFPVAAVLIALTWLAVYFRDQSMFVKKFE